MRVKIIDSKVRWLSRHAFVYETLRVTSPADMRNQSTFIVYDWLGYVIGWFRADKDYLPVVEEKER